MDRVENSYLARIGFFEVRFCEWLREIPRIRIIVCGLAVEYFSVLYFSAIFSGAQLFCSRTKGIEDINTGYLLLESLSRSTFLI